MVLRFTFSGVTCVTTCLESTSFPMYVGLLFHKADLIILHYCEMLQYCTPIPRQNYFGIKLCLIGIHFVQLSTVWWLRRMPVTLNIADH